MSSGLTEVDTLAYAGEVPWHTLGTPLKETFTAESALIKGGLNWNVEKWPLQAIDDGGKGVDQNGYPRAVYARVHVPDYYAIIRQDTKESLGVVGSRYEPIQNADSFSFFDALVDRGEAIYETVGSLFRGRKVWLLARIPSMSFIKHAHGKEDTHLKYIAVVNRHDGKGSLLGYFTTVRVVCNNTLRASLGEGYDRVDIRHTLNAKDRLEQAGKLLVQARFQFEYQEEVTQELASVPVPNQEAFEKYLSSLFPEEEGKKSWKRERLMKQARENFLLEESRFGADWYTAYNAVSGVVDHYSPSSGKEEMRMDSTWFGKGMSFKDQAFKVARSYAV